MQLRAAYANPSFLNSVQVLRFLAATMVLISHLKHEVESSAALALAPIVDPTHIFWEAGVDVFFITSGFVMFHLTRARFREPGFPADFLRRRFARVAPLYWFYTTLYLLAALAAPSSVRQADFGTWRLACSYLFIPWPRADGAMLPILILGWTLNFELFFYLLYACALGFKRRTGLLVLAGVMITLAASHALIPSRYFLATWASEPIILEFLAGIGLAWAHGRGLRLPTTYRTLAVAAGVLLLCLFGASGWHAGQWRPIWAGVPCLLLFLGMVMGPDVHADSWLTKLLVAGGNASFSLYLVHMFVTRALSAVWPRLGLSSTLAYTSIGFASCMLAAFVSYRFVEQPLQRAAQKLLRYRADAQAKQSAACAEPM